MPHAQTTRRLELVQITAVFLNEENVEHATAHIHGTSHLPVKSMDSTDPFQSILVC